MTTAYMRIIVIAKIVQITVALVLQVLVGTQDLETIERVNPSAQEPHNIPLRLGMH